MGIARWVWRLVKLGLLALGLTAAGVVGFWIYHGHAHQGGAHLGPGRAPIVVLGSFVLADGSLGPFGRARLELGVRLLAEGKGRVLIVSGASDAEPMRTAAIALGVPPDKVIAEDRATSTFENLVFSRQIIAERRLPAPILVTDAYHMARARWLAWHVGMEIGGYATVDTISGDGGHILSELSRETAAWWHNLGRAAAWSGLGLLGLSEPERHRLLTRIPALG